MADQTKKIRITLQLIILCLTVLFLYLMIILFPFYQHILIIIFQIALPFLIAGLIAYLLHPVVEWLHQQKIPRPVAILAIFLLFFVLAGLAVYYSLPMMIKQIQEFQTNIPNLVNAYRLFIYDLYDQTSFLPEGFHDRLDAFLTEMEANLADRITLLMKNINVLFDMFIMIAVIPILTFYFLKDYQKLQQSVLCIIPSKYQAFTIHLADKMEDSLGQYIRGQILVCFLVGLLSFFLLKWIGMKYALLLASIIGITNFIPYFGPIIGAIPALLIAFTVSPNMVWYVLIVVMAVQLAEGNLLSPFIVGKSMHIHPVYLILTLFIAAKIAGVIGMILAIPLLAVGRVAVPLVFRQIKEIDR
ncbi:Predicted PurR-regulated permease PerM [Gracilibacillus ureilyticus]|uniref:Predicted PurR-regulated permease PerM n=1 Tax=Gracilibacillus ureilyticus TaxID=531814 RepID=A0A1H9RKK5_9BACI|nr:AI-2E family transporter [Gracilibacillus ureilyticus]SER73391.1 Predicted PurR-regulated permease PerM [Gracilibacillus ureilyticus]